MNRVKWKIIKHMTQVSFYQKSTCHIMIEENCIKNAHLFYYKTKFEICNMLKN